MRLVLVLGQSVVVIGVWVGVISQEKDSVDAILEALEHGVNWIDTAHAYGFGVAEEVVAEALSQWRKKYLLLQNAGFYLKRIVSPREIYLAREYSSRSGRFSPSFKSGIY